MSRLNAVSPVRRTAVSFSPKMLGIQARRLSEACLPLSDAFVLACLRWTGDPVLRLAGLPMITECYRSPERQNELYAQGRTKPGPIVTYKRGGHSKHNHGPPTPAIDVAFLLPDGSVSWSALLLSKFARLMKAADARIVWGGDWKMLDRPHFEVSVSTPRGARTNG